MAEKIKAFEPHIIVNKDADKPYYSIMYYDLADRVWHIGYGSYYLNYVIKWLQKEFEEVQVDFKEVRHGKWNRQRQGFYFLCSVCGKASATKANYCHHCGAKMDGRSDT